MTIATMIAMTLAAGVTTSWARSAARAASPISACTVAVLAALLAQCAPYPDNAIPCALDGAPCPDGYVCATRNLAEGARCLTVGCGDTVVNPANEDCDDGNIENDLDLCVADSDGPKTCRAVEFTFDPLASFGFGPGGVDALEVNIGRPTLVAANERELFVVSAGTNIVGRIALYGDCANGALGASGLCFGVVAGNGSLLTPTPVASDAPSNEIVAMLARSIALDGAGNAFISDLQNNVILRLDAVTGRASTIVGTGANEAGADNVAGTTSPIRQPGALTVDGDGNVLFVDRDDLNAPRIRRWNRRTAKVATVSTQEQVPGPDALAVGPDGTGWALRVVEPGHIELQQFDLETGARLRRASNLVVGTCGAPNSAQSVIVADDVDPDRLYWLEDGAVVEVVVDNAPVGPDVAQSMACSSSPPVRPTVPAGEAFSFGPAHLTRSGATFFIADPASGVVWSLERRSDGFTRPEIFAGKANVVEGDGDGGLSLLADIARGIGEVAGGNVTVNLAQLPQQRCRSDDSFGALEFGLAATPLHRLAFIDCGDAIRGIGAGIPGNRGGVFATAQFNKPVALLRAPAAIGANSPNLFFVADSGNGTLRTLRIDDDGIDGFVDGTPFATIGASGGLAHNGAQLLVSLPDQNRIIAVDPNAPGLDDYPDYPAFDDLAGPTGLLYFAFSSIDDENVPAFLRDLAIVIVAERDAHRVRGRLVNHLTQVFVDGPPLLLAGEDGVAGDEDSSAAHPTGRLREPRAVMFQVPKSAAELSQARLLVFDAFDRVRQIEIDQTLTPTLTTLSARDDVGVGYRARDDGPSGLLRTPTALASFGAGFLVLDQLTGRLRIVDVDPSGSASARTALTVFPDGGGRALAVNAEETTALITSGTNEVTVVELAGAPETWRAARVVVDGAVALAGVAFADDGDVVFSDVGTHQVLRTSRDDFSVVARVGSALGFRDGVRAPGDNGADGPLFNDPEGVAVDVDNDGREVVYVADTGNSRVRRITGLLSGATTEVRTVLGDGESSNGADGSPAVNFSVSGPTAVAVDDAGNLLVAAATGVRMVQVGDRGVAGERAGTRPENDVATTIFGGAPRDGFPQAITSCIADVALRAPRSGARPDLYVVDSCAGLLLRLCRTAGEDRKCVR